MVYMSFLWKKFKSFLYFIISKMLRIEIKDETWNKLLQYIKFGGIGISNTIISYIVYFLLVFWGFHYLFASILGFFASIVNAYFWNNKYVFKEKAGESRVWWQIFFKTFLSYAGTGLILNNILLYLWLDIFGVHYIVGPAINICITMPMNFLLNKYFTYNTTTKPKS